jgi:hypothetical protein
MIEAQRSSPTRILKQRDVAAGGTVRSAALELDGAPARQAASAPAAPARCSAKEARLAVVEGGAHAVEIRCSCGEWTRVELQVESKGEVAS